MLWALLWACGRPEVVDHPMVTPTEAAAAPADAPAPPPVPEAKPIVPDEAVIGVWEQGLDRKLGLNRLRYFYPDHTFRWVHPKVDDKTYAFLPDEPATGGGTWKVTDTGLQLDQAWVTFGKPGVNLLHIERVKSELLVLSACETTVVSPEPCQMLGDTAWYHRLAADPKDQWAKICVGDGCTTTPLWAP